MHVITVVGVGADGWDGLSPVARTALTEAEVIMGSGRQLALLPGSPATRVRWPSPMLPALPGLIEQHAHRRICVLASGDPMFHGVGATLARVLGPERMRVIPHPSSVSLACARLGWPTQEITVVSLVGKPVSLLHPSVQPDHRLLVLGAAGTTPSEVADLLVQRGFGASELHLLENLGGSEERQERTTAAEWGARRAGPLNVLAVHCRANPAATVLPRTPGLPDDAFEHDGQLTKRTVRAVTLSRLAPLPGELLWDVGAGAGSIAIEWMRTAPSCRAIAVEHREDRARRISRNAETLGVPGLRVVTGAAPEALDDLESPAAVFVGGGATRPRVLESCWNALRPGGRMVVNAVTVESEALLATWFGLLGGELVRLAVDQAAPVGGFTGWRSAMPVTQWSIHKGHTTDGVTAGGTKR